MKPINIEPSEHPISFPIALLVSRFNQDITHALLTGALEHLKARGFSAEDITVIEVPGALEIPLIAEKLAQKKQHDVLIALGAVVRGETTHYDYVCQGVSQGCQQVSLTHNIPVIFGVLTTENEAQAWARLGGAHGHKGVDAAECAIEMQQLMKQI